MRQEALDFAPRRSVVNDREVLAGATDAPTAHAAAAKLVRSGRLSRRCRDALVILARATEPMTAMELAKGDEGVRAFLAKRLFDCAKLGRGWARVTGERPCRLTTNPQQTWEITDEGRRVLGRDAS